MMRVILLAMIIAHALGCTGCGASCPAATMGGATAVVTACERAYRRADSDAKVDAVDDVCLPALLAAERLADGGAERLCGE